MQRSSVDLPRPLAATSPIRSPALTTRFRLENSGAFSVTPRLRILMRVMIVFWSCRRSRSSGHAATIGHSYQRAAIDVMRARAKQLDAAWPRRADQNEVLEEISG